MLRRCGADVEDHLVFRDGFHRNRFARRTGLELRRHHRVRRQHHIAARLLRLLKNLLRRAGHVVFAERLADLHADGVQEGVGHAAADHQHVDPSDQVAEQVELGGDFRAADDGRQRALGLLQRGAEMFQFFLHEAPRSGGQQTRDALGRGVGAVRRREGVVHVDVAQRREGLGEARVVGFFLRVEAQVLQQGDAAGLQALRRRFRRRADAVRRETDLLAQDLRNLRHQGLQRHLRVRPALGPAEVGQQQHLRALGRKIADGRRRALQASRVAHLAAGHRHVEVDAHQHALSGDFRVIKCAIRRHQLAF